MEAFFRSPPTAGPAGASPTTTCERHVTRWARPGEEAALARLAIAILASLPGTICLYQGEELGQTETELTYEELTDPPGLRFWPDNKGRDGCRTPMVWDAAAPNAGFSTGRPWLPVKPPQAARAVEGQARDEASVLAAYRRTLAFRQARPEMRSGAAEFLDLPEPLLGIVRRADGAATLCLFNLGREARVPLPQAEAGTPMEGHGFDAAREGDTLVLPPWGAFFGER